MAESERTALLIERDWLHGVALAGGVREGGPSATALSWPLSVSPAPADGTGASGSPAGDAAADAEEREGKDAPGAARAAEEVGVRGTPCERGAERRARTRLVLQRLHHGPFEVRTA